MDTFIKNEVIWPAGWTKLHVLFLPQQEEILPLVDAYRPVVYSFDCLSPVPGAWLHASVQSLNARSAREIPGEQCAELEHELRERVGALAPFTLMAGGALATRSSVYLDLVPDREFAQVIQQSRLAMHHVFGAGSSSNPGRPHITLAYGKGKEDSGLIQRKLADATDMRATVTVSEVWLVDEVQDPILHQYRWVELARIALKG